MVAMTTRTTKTNTTKDYRHTKKQYNNIGNSNCLVFTREKFITAFFNQLAWKRKIKHTLCKPDYFNIAKFASLKQLHEEPIHHKV